MKSLKNKSLAAIGVIALTAPAWAGNSPGEYAESRFGYQPSRAGYGLDAVRPGEEADYWDNHQAPRPRRGPDAPDQEVAGTDAQRGNRSPAGLVVGPSALGAASSHAVAARDERVLDPDAPSGPPEPRTRIEDAPEMERFAMRKKGVQEVALIAGDLGFFPKTVFVSRDVPVRMFVTGASRNTLCIMMDSFQIRKQVRSQKIEEITFTPNQPGRYRFYCPVNGMEGTLVVKELTSS